MRQKDGARAATAEHRVTHEVGPRFTRAAEAERSRLEGKREQLLRERQAVQAEVGRIDRTVGAIDELLELLAPLLAGNGGDPGADSGDGSAQRSTPSSGSGEAARDRALPPDQRRPAKE